MPKPGDADEKRLQILRAAGEVFRRRGFSVATIEEIASAAGVGKGTIYLYFSGKQDIVNSLVTFTLESLHRGISQVIGSADDAITKLHKLIAGHVHFSLKHLDFAYILYRELSELGGEFSDKVLGFTDEYVKAVASVLRQGEAEGTLNVGDPEIVASGVMGLVNTTVFFSARRRADLGEPELTNRILSLLVDGIGARKGRDH